MANDTQNQNSPAEDGADPGIKEEKRHQDNSPAVEMPGRDLTDDHREFLTAHAIDPDLVQDHVRSLVELDDLPEDRDATWPSYVPTVLFHWKMGEREAWQIRIPDKRRTDGGPKYLFAKGTEPPLNCVRDPGGNAPILLAEGSCQHLAAASNAPDKFAVYGMFGCWGWSKVDPSFMADRLIYVVFDADIDSNRDVWNAAKELQVAAKAVKAAGVKFVDVPGSGSTGLDDYLAKIADPARRRDAMATLVNDASTDLPRAPAKKKGKAGPTSEFFDGDQIKPRTIAQAIHAKYPLALSAEDKVAVYRDGVYRTNRLALVMVLAALLDDDYRRNHYGSVEDSILSVLELGDRRLPDHISRPWLNTLDGMVELETGELYPHDARHLSAVQFPVHFDPEATCPEFDRWAKEIIGEQLDDLLEVASVMLDPTWIPTKALLLYGPARSGKSTFLRLLKALAGMENTSGVSLHELSEDQFARANLYGKVLNVSADLSARHVQDLTWFKLMTGEDLVRGNRKYGNDFHFVNQALFAFSANELPTVGESSRAYVERIKPFRFGNSFAGREDRGRELAMLEELPGILNRLVAAYRARKERGNWLETSPDVQREFEQASDRVQMWVAEEMEIVPGLTPGQTVTVDQGNTGKWLAHLFNDWADRPMGRNKVIQRLAQLPGVVEVRLGGHGSAVRGFNVVERKAVPAEPAVPATISETSQLTEQGTGEVKSNEVSQETAGTAGSAGTATADPYTPPDPPPPDACPDCGYTTLGSKNGRRFCNRFSSCGWSGYLAKTWDGAEGLFEGSG
jgi:putative DNA primase/helicase